MALRKNNKQDVVLNSLPIAEQEPSFVIYRSKFEDNDSIPIEKGNEVKKYKLPVTGNELGSMKGRRRFYQIELLLHALI